MTERAAIGTSAGPISRQSTSRTATRVVQFRVSAELSDSIDQLQGETRATTSEIVRAALAYYLAQQPYKTAPISRNRRPAKL